MFTAPVYSAAFHTDQTDVPRKAEVAGSIKERHLDCSSVSVGLYLLTPWPPAHFHITLNVNGTVVFLPYSHKCVLTSVAAILHKLQLLLYVEREQEGF